MFFLAFFAMTAFIVTPVTPHDIALADGTVVKIDYVDNPCGTRGPQAGCAKVVNGVPTIWVSGVADIETLKHEHNHLAGKGAEVQHGPWKLSRYFGNCATITVGNAEYPVGGLICRNEGKRERVVPPGYDDEDCLECRFPNEGPKLMGRPL